MKLLASILSVLAAAACSTVTTSSDYDPEYDFAGLETYTWLESPPDTAVGDLATGRVRTAVDEVLAGLGYRVVEAQADLLITFEVSRQDRVRVTEQDTYGRRRHGTWGTRRVDVYEYQEGTLLLDVIDPETEQLVWRGTATDVLARDRTPEQRMEKTREAVAAMLASFPPEP
jgi:hypothetical protein